MDLNLKSKNALVCGSTDGIGWATACELALLGANICLFARNEDKLKQRLAELPKSFDQNHTYLVADFTQMSAIEQAVGGRKMDFHILVNNTGGPTGGALLAEEPAKFLKTFEQHLLVNQFLAQAVVPFMRAEGFGRIVNIISVSVKQPIVGLGVSNTVRWAVAAWAKTLSKELSHTGITVNNVLPGYTETNRLVVVNQLKAEQEGKTSEEVATELTKYIPSGRFAKPAEVAAAVGFLCSPAAASINGINLPVDGGLSATL